MAPDPTAYQTAETPTAKYGPIFLSPHNDDETLFGAYTIMRHKPTVVVVLRSHLQEQRHGVTALTRETETESACRLLRGPPRHLYEPSYLQWRFHDDAPDWARVEDDLRAMSRNYYPCFAPAVEDGGHEHHSMIGAIASRVWPADQLSHYLTYRRGHGKSTDGIEVAPEPWMIAAKHRALACYLSQMQPELGCLPWFVGDLREYVAY